MPLFLRDNINMISERDWLQTLQSRWPNVDLRHDTFYDPQSRQILTTDMLVEGVHFSWDYFTPQDLGWRSVDEIPPTFARIISDMSPGDVLGPMRAPTGFQLVKLVESRTAADSAPATATQLQARHILIRAGEGGDSAARILARSNSCCMISSRLGLS